jgi:hypothetical protein
MRDGERHAAARGTNGAGSSPGASAATGTAGVRGESAGDA